MAIFTQTRAERVRKEDAVGERSLIMQLNKVSLRTWEVRGTSDALPGILALLERSLMWPRSHYRVFATYPDALPQEWEQDAAYFKWENSGSHWQPEQAVRDSEYRAAVEELCAQPLGLALVHADASIKILAFVIPGGVDCRDSQAIVKSLVDKILEFGRETGRRRIVCVCADDYDLRRILREKGFSGEAMMERTV